MKAQFQDLSITGLIGERCYPVDGSTLRIHLQLSAPPPLGWSFLFTQVWQTTAYPGKRPVGIEGDALWIECAPEDVRGIHLAHLEQALAQTNEHYRAQHLQKQLAAERQRELSRQTQLKLDALARSFSPPPPAEPDHEPGEQPPRSLTGRIMDFLRSPFAPPADGMRDEPDRNLHRRRELWGNGSTTTLKNL